MCLTQNKQTIYYAEYTATKETDSNGFYTGDVVKTYGTPTAISINVSPARGNANQEIFGISTDYTKTLVADKGCPITENSVLWIDKTPIIESVMQPFNYVVVSKAVSLNSVTYAIKEVDVT